MPIIVNSDPKTHGALYRCSECGALIFVADYEWNSYHYTSAFDKEVDSQYVECPDCYCSVDYYIDKDE